MIYGDFIKDKTGKAFARLNYGFCIGDTNVLYANKILFTETSFWISAVTGEKGFSMANIGGNSDSYFEVVDGEFNYFENGSLILNGTFSRLATEHFRVTLSRGASKTRVFIDRVLIASTDTPSSWTTSTNNFSISSQSVFYDLRFNQSEEKEMRFAGTSYYTNEQAWLPCQEGYGVDLKDVINDFDFSLETNNWVKKRYYTHYNQFYGFDLDGSARVPRSYSNSEDYSTYIKDDGETWFDFSITQPVYFNKNCYVNNTFGLPEIFTELIYLSEFYYKVTEENNLYVWNLAELYKPVFDSMLIEGVNYSFYSQRKLEDTYPVALTNILYYNRKITLLEENYIYSYFNYDDRGDDKSKYPIPNYDNINNVVYEGDNQVLLDEDHYLIYD